MDFLRHCADLLNEGTPGEEVMCLMRERYKTPGCLKVKTCLVRKMCEKEGEPLPKNVRDLHVTMEEVRECKRKARVARLEKNLRRTSVEGEEMVSVSRKGLKEATTLSDLALCLMFCTGRRSCEVLCGRSTFSPVLSSHHAALFSGQAKRGGRRGQRDDPPSYVIPLLAPFEEVRDGYSRLREMQKNSLLTKEEASRRYQPLLSRRISSRMDCLSKAGKPHGLRGAYVCTVLKAFSWGEMSDSYVVMKCLGHGDIDESLVYTTFDVGEVRLNLGAVELSPQSETDAVMLSPM